VQSMRRVYRSFTPSLWGCNRVVECNFLVVWRCLGYASQGKRFVGKLEGAIGQS
jgi:hypothetical protein